MLSENRSRHAAQVLEDVCLNHEKNFQNLLRENPPVIQLLSNDLARLDGNDTCAVIAQTFPYHEQVPSFLDKCMEAHNGLMQTGISNAMIVIYRFLGEKERLVGDFNKDVDFFWGFFNDEEYLELLESLEYIINYGLNHL